MASTDTGLALKPLAPTLGIEVRGLDLSAPLSGLQTQELRCAKAMHPVVARHPVTSARFLFVNAAFSSHIVQLGRDESTAVLQQIYQHIRKHLAFRVRVHLGAEHPADLGQRGHPAPSAIGACAHAPIALGARRDAPHDPGFADQGSDMPTIDRRSLLGTTLAAALAAAPGARAADPEKLRIGYQKSSTLTIWLKSRGVLEKALARLNVAVGWHEFTSGLPLLEALNIGAVDLSADVADAVPPFALAAGAKLACYAIESPSPQAQAVVVKKDSPITSVAQLKGQKLAFAKGAGAHFLLLQALQRAGLTIKDVEPAHLSPADGRAAFENGSVAAWVIWDPFLAAVQRQAGARILVDGAGLSACRPTAASTWQRPRLHSAAPTCWRSSMPNCNAPVSGSSRTRGQRPSGMPR